MDRVTFRYSANKGDTQVSIYVNGEQLTTVRGIQIGMGVGDAKPLVTIALAPDVLHIELEGAELGFTE